MKKKMVARSHVVQLWLQIFLKHLFFSMWHHGDDERHDDDACDGDGNGNDDDDDGDSGVVLY